MEPPHRAPTKKCQQLRSAETDVLYEKGREVVVGKRTSMNLGSHYVADAVLMCCLTLIFKDSVTELILSPNDG